MKICIPTLENKEGDSKVSQHFGSAPFFLIYDSEKKSFQSINNRNQHHEHGACSPLKTFSDDAFDAIVVNGIGERAMTLIKEKGMKVYKTSAFTVADIIKQFNSGNLTEIDPECCCEGHGCR